MKREIWVLATVLLCVSSIANARDVLNRYSIEEAMNSAEATSQLNRGYTYRFGNATNADVVTNHGHFQANKKTNAVGKTDKFACQWAFCPR